MTDESMVQAFFGSPQEFSGNTDNGYILFYESLAEKSWCASDTMWLVIYFRFTLPSPDDIGYAVQSKNLE